MSLNLRITGLAFCVLIIVALATWRGTAPPGGAPEVVPQVSNSAPHARPRLLPPRDPPSNQLDSGLAVDEVRLAPLRNDFPEAAAMDFVAERLGLFRVTCAVPDTIGPGDELQAASAAPTIVHGGILHALVSKSPGSSLITDGAATKLLVAHWGPDGCRTEAIETVTLRFRFAEQEEHVLAMACGRASKSVDDSFDLEMDVEVWPGTSDCAVAFHARDRRAELTVDLKARPAGSVLVELEPDQDESTPLTPNEIMSVVEDFIAFTGDRSGGLAPILEDGGVPQEVAATIAEWAKQNTELRNQLEDDLLDMAETWRKMSAEADEPDLEDHK